MRDDQSSNDDGAAPAGVAMSFRGKLFLAWAIVLLGAAGLSAAAFIAADRSVASELVRVERQLNDITAIVVDQLRAVAVTGADDSSLAAMGGALLDLQLAEHSGVEGGVWSITDGFVAYVFPTYDGSTPKTQLPAAELPSIESLSRRALDESTITFDAVQGQREALIRAAQPLDANSALVVWSMKRVPIGGVQMLSYGALAAACLSLLIVVVGLWLTWHLARVKTELNRVVSALSTRPVENMPVLSDSTSPELHRIGRAINLLSADLRAAKADATNLGSRLRSAERLAAVGRISAALAHEIRNPLGTIRLRAENALAQPGTASLDSFHRILEEVARLERLVRSLLELGREVQIKPQPVDVQSWAAALAASVAPRMTAAEVELRTQVNASTWVFDPVHCARAVENLLINALAFAPTGSIVRLIVEAGEDLAIRVEDQGPGVGEDIAERIFEPFFTTRDSGTGLGLSLVREIAEAHAGSVTLVRTEIGACFELRIPCHAFS